MRPMARVAGMATKRNKSVQEQARRRDGCCLYGLVAQDGCVPGFDVAHIRSYGSSRTGGDVLENVICLCRKHHQMHERADIEDLTLQMILYEWYGYGPEQWITDKLDIVDVVGTEAGCSMHFAGDHKGIVVSFEGAKTRSMTIRLSAIEAMMPAVFREMITDYLRRE